VKSDNPEGMKLAHSGQEAWIDVNENTLKEHRKSIERRVEEAQKALTNLEARLQNKSYIEKAPAALVEETQKEVKIKRELIETLSIELNVIGELD
jgi:valyl-tRNA synthetase